jgi:hypothetical protein
MTMRTPAAVSFSTARTILATPSVRRRRWAAAALLLAAMGAQAQTGFEEEFDDADKPWQEIAVQLPSVPQAANLLPFYVSPTATQSFAIDAKSVSVGADGVIRYTLIATSNAGAKNISYEGIRCATLEKKIYAIGQQDGSWARSRRDQWERIHGYADNRPHIVLVRNYFCDVGTVAGSAEDMVERIRYQRSIAPQNGGA